MDISIVIAHRGDPIGLWSSIHSCIEELKHTQYSYEFCICVNGEGERRRQQKLPGNPFVCPDTERVLHFLNKAGLLGYVKILQGSVSPPTARNLASKKATGKYLFFFDNHILVSRNYFREAIVTFRDTGASLVHSKTVFFTGEDDTYEYNLLLDKTFWATASVESMEPWAYPVAAAGHGGFAILSSVWQEVGGYPPVFDGYAGEELTLDLQLWMRGYEVWLNPYMVHYHWAGNRPYRRHFTDDYYRNLLMSANIIGGEKYLYEVYRHFVKNFPAPLKNPFFDILVEAYYTSEPHRQTISKHYVRTLDEQLAYFKQNGIPH